MDRITSELFGGFPRRVGTPAQHWVFNEAQFDLFLDKVEGRRNCYSTVGTLQVDGRKESSTVLFDLDSPAKEDGDWVIFSDEPTDDEVVSRMRSDPDVADSILGDVCEDARQLAQDSADDGIPIVGVFSGFGIHVHQLYQETLEPETAMATCGAKYAVEGSLQTPDWSVFGQADRICRVPNCERVTTPGGNGTVEDGRGTGIYTVPLSQRELARVSPEMLVGLSAQPRDDVDLRLTTRPQMPVWSDYKDEAGASADSQVPNRPLDERTQPLESEGLREMLEDLLQMPCMVERILQPNPEHLVRMNCAVLLFNVGLNPQQVQHLYAQLGWVDYDPAVTSKQLRYIWNEGYSDMSCSTLQNRGLCVRTDTPDDCPCHGWSGGESRWTQ